MKSLIRIPKRALYVVAAVSICVIGASAFRLATRASANPDPFQGISAAENAPVLPASDPAIAQMQMSPGGGPFGENLNGVRRLPSTIAGHAAYVMPTNSGAFCLVVAQMPEACDKPFTASTSPVLFIEGDPDGSGSGGTTAFGIAEDGVVSITMTVDGSQVKVPVQANTFQYTGGSSVTPESITDVTANFADGRTVGLN